tara:strand:- start:386 stop:970 length:585 start_codon:yes stop_codon:yes gene_type:complete
VIKRKTKLLVIQFLIFFTAILLIYLTYYQKQDDQTKNFEKNKIIETKTDDKKNFFEDVQYRGVDLNGNRFIIESKTAEFDAENPNDIFMYKMLGYFYFKDGSVLRIQSDRGRYNNETQDTEFKDNIIAEHRDNVLYSDNIDYLNSKGLLKIYGNIRGNTDKGQILADTLNYDLKKETLSISMFDNDLIDVKVKK